MTYKRILVGTDGSETAKRAVLTAAELAKAVGAELIVASSYRDLAPDELAALERGAPDELRWQITASAQADDNVTRGREAAAKLGVETTGMSLAADRPAEALVDAAETHGVDLLVTGNKGMSGAKRFLIGSVPDFVAHHAPCDVLIDQTS